MNLAAAPLRWLPRPRRTLRLAEPPVTRMLVLQPTPFCNIDCSYCYLPDRQQRHRMSVDTARLAARRLREDGLAAEALTVVWHAGEPLAVPPAFYAEAFAAIAAELPGCRVEHAIQTNATLVDDTWCRLFTEHGVRVGISLDGPADLHDLHRRTRHGKGTHAQVMQGLARLQAHGVPCHAIAVVTGATLARADDFHDFFAAHGIHDVGCNFDEAEGGHAASSLAGQDEAHAAFLQRLLKRSVAGGGAVVYRELAAAWRLVAEPLPEYTFEGRRWPLNPQVMPLALVSVAWNGDFSTFSPELLGQRHPAFADFVLGNVAQGGYLAQVGTPAFQRLWQAVAEGVDACRRGCTHFAYCGGGAPANKLYENGSFASAETLYCRSMIQRPFDTVLGQLEQDLAARAA